jgi:hypothetical protein
MRSKVVRVRFVDDLAQISLAAGVRERGRDTADDRMQVGIGDRTEGTGLEVGDLRGGGAPPEALEGFLRGHHRC